MSGNYDAIKTNLKEESTDWLIDSAEFRNQWLKNAKLAQQSDDSNHPITLMSPTGRQPYKWGLYQTAERTPGLFIALLLSLFFSTSFGLAIFPAEWEFPSNVPRAIGVQMFFLSTMICQVVLTFYSSFPWAFGMFMVENIPFLQVIARIAIDSQGQGIETFSTVFFIFALSSVVVGACFYLLGHFKLGNVVHFFPKHVIVGCIGGIGVFIFQTGFEVSANMSWNWDLDSIQRFSESSVWPHWLLSVILVLILRILKSYVFPNFPLLPPLYFMLIPPIFYLALCILEIPIEEAHLNHWFFERGPSIDNPWLLWELIDFTKIKWSVVADSIPTVIALTLFSLMHVPINIPALSMSTNHNADMNKELVAHGISNIVSGLCGGLQNYLCYCNSLLYYKCNGQGTMSGIMLTILEGVCFYYGPTMVYYVPRCMAGCLLCHVGIDLTKEGVWDSRKGLDTYEYISALLIAIVMTFYGLTAGLVLGVILAAITFTIQIGQHVPPIRNAMRGTTLRSSKWRSKESNDILNKYSRHILVVQLQGQLFFGNASLIATAVEKLLEASEGNRDIWYVILDFTLVLGIDSSAIETLTQVFETCYKYKVKLVYAKPVTHGFLSEIDLTGRLLELAEKTIEIAKRAQAKDQESNEYIIEIGESNERNLNLELLKLSRGSVEYSGGDGGHSAASEQTSLFNHPSNGNGKGGNHNGYSSINNNFPGTLPSFDLTFAPPVPPMHRNRSWFQMKQQTQVQLAFDLDDAVAWCEEGILDGRQTRSPISKKDRSASIVNEKHDLFKLHADKPRYLRQLYALCPYDESTDSIDKLFQYFELKRTNIDNVVLWEQGGPSVSAIILVSGKLVNSLQEEAGTTEPVEVGHLVGEYGLLTGQARHGTLTAVEPSVYYELSQSKYEEMKSKEPKLAFILCRICLGYLGHRVMHVSNRIWESRCLPV